ncbi:c-type cytochrome domain-containing protein [Zestomonas insulae]|uniref:c-type cytochrome domain-containing protein n=1 Tax=Zestomonas insulae TaxID=2809017 RepID=UPI003211C719
MSRFPWRVLGAVLLINGAVLGEAAGGSAGEVLTLLRARCVICHSGPGAPSGLQLDSLDGLLAGSRNGPVVKPGQPLDSELLRRLKGLSQPRMPLTGPPFLSDAEIALVEAWIVAGAPLELAADTAPVAAPAAEANPPPPGAPVTYAQVAPILLSRCAKCHTESGLMGAAPEGYRLDSYAATVASGERARVVPGQVAASELVRRIRGQARPRMPFDGPPYLSDAQIALIEAWIADGARDVQGMPAPVPVGARLRLHGQLAADGRLDELPLTIGARTRRDKAPQPGDYVQVRGRLAADGRVLVERIRPR